LKTNSDPQEPIFGLGASWTIVASTIALFFILVGLDVLHESKVILSSQESAWLASQRSPASQAVTPLGDETIVSMQRLGCFGWCPQYEVSLFGSGRVEFRGHRFVCQKTPPFAQVDPGEVAALVRGFVNARFHEMPSYTDEDATDAETIQLTLKRAGSVHTVNHYEGDIEAPRILTWMEDRVDEVANTSTWIGTVEGQAIDEATCTLPDGTKRRLSEIGESDF